MPAQPITQKITMFLWFVGLCAAAFATVSAYVFSQRYSGPNLQASHSLLALCYFFSLLALAGSIYLAKIAAFLKPDPKGNSYLANEPQSLVHYTLRIALIGWAMIIGLGAVMMTSKFWYGFPIIAVAVASLWLARPRRSRA